MPNWCSNTLNISGTPEEVAQVNALILNSDDELDFEVLAPMPVELSGLYGDTTSKDFHFFDTNSKRMGLLPPKEFIEQAMTLVSEHSDNADLKRIDVSDLSELIETSDLINDELSVEASIEQAVRQWAGLPHEDRIKTNSPLYSDAVKKMLALMLVENKIYCEAHYGWQTAYYWAVANWGTKWNVSESYRSEDYSPDNATYFFETAWGYPRDWFDKLIGKVREMENSVSVTLNFAEDGVWFGGEVGIGDDGAEIDRAYLDDEIESFLGLEEFDNDENDDDDE